MNLRLVILFVASAIALGSCGDDQIAGPTEGTIMVATITTGDDQDGNGYTFSVNNGISDPIGLQEEVFVPALEPGDYVVSLAGMAANCTVPPDDNPQTAIVVPGDTVDVLFDVTCELIDPGDGGGGGPPI